MTPDPTVQPIDEEKAREAFEAWCADQHEWFGPPVDEVALSAFLAGRSSLSSTAFSSPPATGEGGREPQVIGVDHGKPGGDKSVRLWGSVDSAGKVHIDRIEEIDPPSTGGGDVEALVEALIRAAWDWGDSCGVDGVPWGHKGDSYNEWKREDTEKAKKRLLTALAARRPGPSVEEVATQNPSYDQVARIMDGEAAGSWFATEYEHFKQRVIPAVLALFSPPSETHAEEKP